MTAMVIPNYMTNIVVTLGQDIHFDKFTGYLVKYCFHDHFSSDHKNGH